MNIIEERIASLKQDIANIEDLACALNFAEELKAKFTNSYQWTSIGVNCNYIDISFSFVTMDDAKSVLRAIAKSGRKIDKPRDFANIKMMAWRCGDIEVTAHFLSEKPESCKYVQTGVKEVPVFELRCGPEEVAL